MAVVTDTSLITAGELASGAVGSSTTISRSDPDMTLQFNQAVIIRESGWAGIAPDPARDVTCRPHGATNPACVISVLFSSSSSSRNCSMSLPVKKIGFSACFSI
jgi:hypothetical protein